MTVLAGGRIVADPGIEFGWIEIADGVIAAIGSGPAPKPADVDLGGHSVIPGFVDQHCHGGGGNSFVTTDPDEARQAAAVHLRHGSTTVMASLVSASRADLKAQIRALSPLVDDGTVTGIHLEGPWISSLQCGAHDPKLLRPPEPGEVAELFDLADGRISMVTLAPELPGGLAAVAQIVDLGAVAAVGHTDADYDLARQAIDAGASVATHLMNAMPPLHHRNPGPVDALLADDRVTVELICDGTHVHPAMLRLAIKLGGVPRVAAITDAMAAAGAAAGHYLLGNLDVEVSGGVARLAKGGAIAGSTLLMDEALRYLVFDVGVSLPEASQMLSANPARVLGLTDRGNLAVGQRADLIIVDPDLTINRIMRAGEWVE